MMAVAEAQRYPCAPCGADLRCAPGQTELVCDHCGHRQDIPNLAPRRKARALGEIPLAQGLSDDLPTDAVEEVRASSCPNCGAVVEFQGASHASECPFCATPVVADTGLRRHIKPQALVPFALTETQAREALKSGAAAKVLKAYVANFGPRLIGLTGSPEEIAAIAKAYRAYYAKAGNGSTATDYLMDHSSIIYLMGPDGRFVEHMPYTTDAAKLATELKETLRTSP